jgi:hypothetical protein
MAATMSSTHRVGTNLMLTSVLAALSYLPFELIAKTTVIVGIILFIWDPIPPLTRLLSFFMTLFVLLLSRIERHWRDYRPSSEDNEHKNGKLD